jgi:hypothetical protein
LQEGFYYNGRDILVLMALRPCLGLLAFPQILLCRPADLFRSAGMHDSFTYDPYILPLPLPLSLSPYLPKISLSLIPMKVQVLMMRVVFPPLGKSAIIPIP